MPISMDGRLNYRSWDEEPAEWSYLGPFASNEERLCQQALTVAQMTGQEIQENVQNVLPQVEVFRQRFGYPDYQDRQAQIVDIVGTSRTVATPTSSWYSGTPAGIEGGSRFASNNLGMV